jgi:class 3 adenylate cyclase
MPNAPDVDPRLGRAGELAAFLRDNPRQARRDADDLGRQFGVDAALVAHIKTSSLLKTHKPVRKVEWAATGKRLVETVRASLERLVSNPYVFQVAAAILCAGAAFVPTIGFAVAALAWAVAELACFLLRPAFRNALFGSAIVWVGTGAFFGLEFRAEKLPGVFSGSGGHVLLIALLGVTFAIMNLFAGGILVVLGGALQISAHRRKEAALSRQDLLSRMFFLQEQLGSIPPRQEKPPHPVVLAFRDRLLLYSILLMLVPLFMGSLTTILLHVDPFAVRQSAQTFPTSGSKNIRVSSVDVPVIYLLSQMSLSVLRTLSVVFLGFMATSWRKVGLVAAGLTIAEALNMAWSWPAGAYGSSPVSLVVTSVAGGAVSSLVIMMLVRFSVGFNRTLARARLGPQAEESAILSELLEIRYRLFSNPVQVCVLVVDAAGSTQMKRNADPLMVEFSFGRYQNWIAETVSRNGGKVDMMTGDGAICAFGTAENALAAARQLQGGVAALNAEQNRLPSPFRLRIALHAGAVVADLDKVQFTEVIDVAAHVEKFSPIGGIALTAPFLQALPSVPTDLPSSASVDGVDIFTIPA